MTELQLKHIVFTVALTLISTATVTASCGDVEDLELTMILGSESAYTNVLGIYDLAPSRLVVVSAQQVFQRCHQLRVKGAPDAVVKVLEAQYKASQGELREQIKHRGASLKTIHQSLLSATWCPNTGCWEAKNAVLIRNAVLARGLAVESVIGFSDCGDRIAIYCDDQRKLDCEVERSVTIGGKQIWRVKGTGAIAFKSGMSIDADGAPRAYCPDGRGLDYLANAKDKSGRFVGVVTRGGVPVLQGSTDPCPGCYVSQTSLTNNSRDTADPRRYANSEVMPYIALPPQLQASADVQLGDMAYVVNVATGGEAFATFADIGPRSKLGEGSIALARALGLASDPRTGGTQDGIIYIVFPRSGRGPGVLPTPEEIIGTGESELEQVGGRRLVECLKL